nr:hypothetical protein CFP56_64243 [Quercus suber]
MKPLERQRVLGKGASHIVNFFLSSSSTALIKVTTSCIDEISQQFTKGRLERLKRIVKKCSDFEWNCVPNFLQAIGCR